MLLFVLFVWNNDSARFRVVRDTSCDCQLMDARDTAYLHTCITIVENLHVATISWPHEHFNVSTIFWL